MGSPLEQTPLTAADASSRATLTDWRVQGELLQASFRVSSMPKGAQLVARVVAAAEELNHHPDLDLRFRALHIAITTHSAGSLTEADAALAEKISQIAAELQCPPRSAPVQLEIAVAADDAAAVSPFWESLLTYSPTPAGEGRQLGDKASRMPNIRFAQPQSQRDSAGTASTRVEIFVPHDVAVQRVADVLAAGGRIVDESQAPRVWVLADPAGNEACVRTWQSAG